MTDGNAIPPSARHPYANGTLYSTVYTNPRQRCRCSSKASRQAPWEVDLVNTMGQVLEHSTHQVNKAATLPVQFSAQPANILAARRRPTGERSVTRLTIL
jgi:hypothetical protein